MKIFDVKGEMFDIGRDYPTQDFEFNSTLAIELADAKIARKILDIRPMHSSSKPEMFKQLEKRPDYELQVSRDKASNKHLDACPINRDPAGTRSGNSQSRTVEPEDSDDILQRWLQNFHLYYDAEFLSELPPLLENLKE
ncbi:hypothetical protein F4818DRAFT_436735 [Hypoxylon cercidicola]|nr:hypothetical protein F4818DRAFT_436735 [Hypoxylon cercidicola]